jgi:hypothetical protein
MADEPKQPWYKSVPGTLTAATGFIAALSGLVAGINQLGLFKRAHPAPQTATAPAPATGVPVAPATIASGGSSNADASRAKGEESSTAPPGVTATAQRAASRTAAAAPSPGGAAKPAPAAAPPTPTPAAAETDARLQRLPSGTRLELAVPARTCPADGKEQRFTARLTAPIRVGGAVVLPANTTAVLHAKKNGSATPDVRLDSLIRQRQPFAVPSSDVEVTRGAGGGCLRAGARLAVTLTAPVTVRR